MSTGRSLLGRSKLERAVSNSVLNVIAFACMRREGAAFCIALPEQRPRSFSDCVCARDEWLPCSRALISVSSNGCVFGRHFVQPALIGTHDDDNCGVADGAFPGQLAVEGEKFKMGRQWKTVWLFSYFTIA